ncbi:uncharacterized protein LOC129291301 [Prosopis cineraria]|uniref:uncharacterized protein LOC129291301 n=1 Tax=Prosopis cineraria TaxID=364024 RepID=UPI00240F33D7|nr:uncharacterized protein LOC129291301 [Prosopis cineraria]
MEVEVEGEDGTKFVLGTRGEVPFGRGSGFNTNNRTVSRRHVLFRLRTSLEKIDAGGKPRVSFEVIGRNPIWLFSKNDGQIRIFRKFEKGELEVGDRFCLSGKAPVWFDLKYSRVRDGNKTVSDIEKEVSESSSNGLDIEDIDVSGIDTVKEFGFLVMGHEFDHYPKDMIRNVKSWNWFLEEPGKDSEDEDDFEEQRTAIRRKRKKAKGNGDEDDDWVESEEDVDLIANTRKVRSGYSTRSKDQNKQTKDNKGSKSSGRKKAPRVYEIVEDEGDETLGGFIVDDEEEGQEEESGEEEEEEEFEEDEVED